MTTISKKRVPNLYADHPQVVVIGESPGEDEEYHGVPFTGTSGQILRNALVSAGFDISRVSFLNLCQFKPYNNKFEYLLNSIQLHEGTNEAISYVKSLSPTQTVIITLGNWPSYTFCGLPSSGITSFRGYKFPNTYSSCPTIVTVHPAAVTRDGTLYPLFNLDIKKAFTYFKLSPPDEKLDITLISDDITAELTKQKLIASPQLFSDIETTKKDPSHIICCGFADTPSSAYVYNMQDSFHRHCVKEICESGTPIGYHNGIFDTLVLAINGINVKNYNIDTTVPMHIMEPELPRSLEALVANYTFMDYYKKAGRAALPSDIKEWGTRFNYNDVAVYNAKDCIATYKVWIEEEIELESFPNGMEFFQYEMEDIQVARDLSLNGLLVDIERRQLFLDSTFIRWHKRQLILDNIAGFSVNVNSPRDVPNLLYDVFKLPPRTKDKKVTTDEDAIVSLASFCKEKVATTKTAGPKAEWEIKLTALKLIIEIRGLRKLISSYLKCPISVDNRIRSTYKAIGPETGRWAAAKFVDKTGLNAQTFPRGTVKVDYDKSTSLIINALSTQLVKDEEVEDDAA